MKPGVELLLIKFGMLMQWQLLFWTAFLLLICRNDFSITFQFAMFVDLQIGGLSTPYNLPLNHCCCQPESDPMFPLTFVILYCCHGSTTTLCSTCALYFDSTVELWSNHISALWRICRPASGCVMTVIRTLGAPIIVTDHCIATMATQRSLLPIAQIPLRPHR